MYKARGKWISQKPLEGEILIAVTLHRNEKKTVMWIANYSESQAGSTFQEVRC